VQVQGEGAAEKSPPRLESPPGRRVRCHIAGARAAVASRTCGRSNEEVVARAIRACPVPVVTGIGHETTSRSPTSWPPARTHADRRSELVSPERAEPARRVSPGDGKLACASAGTRRRMLHVDHLPAGWVHPTRAAARRTARPMRLRLGQAAESRPNGAGRSSGFLQRPVKASNTDKLLATSLQLAARCALPTHATLERASSLAPVGRQSVAPGSAAVLERGYSVVRDGAGRIVLRGGSLLPATSSTSRLRAVPMHASSDLGRNRDRRSSRLQIGLAWTENTRGRGCGPIIGERL